MQARSTPLADSPATPGRSLWRHALATLGVFLVALAVLSIEASSAGFEADEADYVATSRYFGYLFLQRDVSRKEWGSNHWTRTQPPLTRYVIGAWLTGYGYDLETMNQPYVSTASSYEVNVQKGRVPTDDVLARARQPMVLLGAGAIALLYLLGLLLGGPVAGLAAVALALSSPFLRYTFVHAWAEAPLSYFLLLAALLASLGARRVQAGVDWLWWGLGLGVVLGLASATKLTGIVGILIVLGVAAILAALRWRAEGRPAARRAVLWAGCAAAVAVVLMVALNPYLWRGPISGFAGMIEERRTEMADQQQQWPEFAVLDVRDRPWLMAVGTTRFGPWAEMPALAVPLGLGFAALGLWALRGRLSPRAPEPTAAMLLAWLSGYALAIFGGLGLSYPRYFLPACLLLLPLTGAGVVAAVGYLTALVRPARAPRAEALSAASSARSR